MSTPSRYTGTPVRKQMRIRALMLLAVSVSCLLAPSLTLAQTDGETEALKPVVHSEIQWLRQRLSLTNSDLAMAGCDQAAAQSVFVAVKDWHEQNRDALRQRRQAVTDAKRQLRQTWQRIHTGQSDQEASFVVQQRQDALGQAQQQLAQLLSDLQTTVSSELTFQQQQRWQHQRANADLPHRFASLGDLSSQRKAQLRTALARGHSGEQVIAEVLSLSQRSALDAALQRQHEQMQGVLAAEQQHLPAPSRPQGPTAVRSGDE